MSSILVPRSTASGPVASLFEQLGYYRAWAPAKALDVFRRWKATVRGEISALDPIAATDDPASRIGDLWEVTQRDDGHVITQKNGKTAGYTSYLALDRVHRRGVIVLADVDRGVDELGQQLLLASLCG